MQKNLYLLKNIDKSEMENSEKPSESESAEGKYL